MDFRLYGELTRSPLVVFMKIISFPRRIAPPAQTIAPWIIDPPPPPPRPWTISIDAPQRILSDGLANAAAAAVNLSRIEHVRRTIRRYREGDPAVPQNRADVPVIQNEFQSTSNGDRFLLYDSGVGDANRIIIFATDECLDLHKQSDHWFADGTFSVSPAIFFQVYTVHAICNGKVVP